jgi:hypothetical protein
LKGSSAIFHFYSSGNISPRNISEQIEWQAAFARKNCRPGKIIESELRKYF